jgi:hypothetical protein
MTSMMPQDTHTETGMPTGGASTVGSPGAAAETVKARASQVAGEGSAQAGRIADDVRHQLRDATHRTLGDVRSQADDRAQRAAEGLRSLSTRAQALAAGRTEEAGNLGDVVQKVGDQANQFALRLETGGVQGLVDDVARFGRTKPLAFLAAAVGAGFVVGRLVRTTAEVAGDSQSGSGMQSGNGMQAGNGMYDDEFPGARS